MKCTVCSSPLQVQRSTRKYCSDACRFKAYRARKKPQCHQRKIRERIISEDPQPVMQTLKGCTVEQITVEEARPIILKYEWLGTIGRAHAAYGLRDPDGELIGVALFGQVGAPEAGDICGKEYREKAICLERGACVHWAHPHAASFLISRAVKLACRDHGWRIVYAYSDPDAGEIGTVYQACNWLYLGQGVGRGRNNGVGRSVIISPEGERITPRGMRHRGIKVADVRHWPGWQVIRKPAKHKYCWLADKRLAKLIRYPLQPYPKR